MALSEDDKKEVERLIIITNFQLKEAKRFLKKSKPYNFHIIEFMIGGFFIWAIFMLGRCF